MRRTSMTRRAGFTLVELILVVTILGIMAGVVALNVRGSGQKARVNAAKTQIKTFETALETFDIHMGRYPTADEGLKALVENLDGSPDWAGPYLRSREVPKDPWKRDYIYNPDGTRGIDFDVYSVGPDGQDGTEDDIGNWTEDAQ
ncbi:type II secretion system major pseudopilin GspG [bacterium]|nr:type II secretion system major pseudopilin GspG [bacterium]